MAKSGSPSILQAIEDRRLFGSLFRDLGTWGRWLVLLRVVFGLPLTAENLSTFRQFTDRETPPADPREVWVIAGRGAGKSFISALVAVYMAIFGKWDLGPGERGYVMCFATDRRQAGVVFSYVKAILQLPGFKGLVVRELSEELELHNGLIISVVTASWRAPRGFSVVCCICDEVAFWYHEGASPAKEILRAVRPGLARVARSKLICVSTPYSQQGPLFETYEQKYGEDWESGLVWLAPTAEMNPTFDAEEIERALQEDHESARAEYFCEFRSDVASYLDPEAVDSCVVDKSRHMLPYREGTRYFAFCDPSGGRHDNFSMALATFDSDRERVILERLESRRPPFRPADVVVEFAKVLQEYDVDEITGDRYAGSWVSDEFSKHSIRYMVSELTKSELYLELQPPIMQGGVELLNNKHLIEQLKGLQRRTRSGGKDIIDHFPGRRDDDANVLAGAVWLARKGAGTLRKGRVHIPLRPTPWRGGFIIR